MSKTTVVILVTAVAIVVGAAAYTAGREAGRSAPLAAATAVPQAQPAQSQNPFIPPEPFMVPQPAPEPAPGPQPFQAPGQPPAIREFIPIPGPGDQMPGMQPDEGECEPIILFYHNGQLFQLRPGQGPQDGQGIPGAPPEFFYMNPYQGPPIPGLPAPRPDRGPGGPGFTPVNPRS